MGTKIAYCDETVNPLKCGVGKVWKYGYLCVKSSPGCKNCYAETLNMRFGNELFYQPRKTQFPFTLDLSVFDKLPKKPKRVFVQDMSDLFLPGVPEDMILLTLGACAGLHLRYGHTFMFLTKHPKEMLKIANTLDDDHKEFLKVLHLGVTVCNQKEADEKIPILLQIPAAVRFLSIEPMLGEIDLRQWLFSPVYDNPDWIIVGCESLGKKAGRKCEHDWIQLIVNDCADASVPCFVKQIPIDGKVSHNMNEWPESLRVRQWPQSKGE